MAERVAVHKDLIVGLLEHLSQSVPKENVTKLNELLAANCRILRNEEIPMGTQKMSDFVQIVH